MNNPIKNKSLADLFIKGILAQRIFPKRSLAKITSIVNIL